GGGSLSTSTEKELQLAGRFLKKGYTDAQAKLKAVWEHPNIASICSEMPNRKILMANVSAALNRTQFTTKDMESLAQYAHKTRSEYCMGCAHICESTVNANIPISDIMRYLMYWRSYDDRNRAVGFFNNIPKEMRSHMGNQDYSQAEKMCPQQMPISKLIREAVTELS
ncbi:MAG: aldo/keto reductase, partial [Desulfobacterales bacterium]